MKRKKLVSIGIAVMASLCILGFAGCGPSGGSDAAKSNQTEVPEQTQEATETPDATEEDMAEVTQEEQGEYVPGELTADVWESKWLNLRFSPPAGLTLMAKEDMDAMMNATAEILKKNNDENKVDDMVDNAKYEMVATSGGGSMPNVVVCVETKSSLISSCESYLGVVKRSLDATGFGYAYEDISECEIAGQSYSSMVATMTARGMEVHQVCYVRQVGDKFVTLSVSYPSDMQAEADAIMASFTAVE